MSESNLEKMMEMLLQSQLQTNQLLAQLLVNQQAPEAPVKSSKPSSSPAPKKSKAAPKKKAQKVSEEVSEYVTKANGRSGVQTVTEATCVHINERMKSATFRLKDSFGFRLTSKQFHKTNEVDFDDLEIGTEYETVKTSGVVKVEKPVFMRCFIERIEEKYFRVQWQGVYGSIFNDGILNNIEAVKCFEAGETQVLEVLPYYVIAPQYSKRGKKPLKAWVEAVEKGVSEEEEPHEAPEESNLPENILPLHKKTS